MYVPISIRYVYEVLAQFRLFGENLCKVVESTSQKRALASVYCYYEKKVDPFG